MAWNIDTDAALSNAQENLDNLYASAYGSAERRRIAQTMAVVRRLREQQGQDMDWPDALEWAGKVMALAARVERMVLAERVAA